MMWSKNYSADQSKTILWSHHAKTGEFREIQGNSAKLTNTPMSSFGLSAENMEQSPIY